jgi:hypothetical protein
MIEGPVKGGLGGGGKTAPGQLAHVQVIPEAFAASPFAGAGFIGTVAILQVSVFVTVHNPSRRPLENTLFCPITALGSKFNPQNTRCILPGKFFARLELKQNRAFSRGLTY